MTDMGRQTTPKDDIEGAMTPSMTGREASRSTGGDVSGSRQQTGMSARCTVERHNLCDGLNAYCGCACHAGRETTACESHLWTFGSPVPCKRGDGHDGEHHYDTTPPRPGHPLYREPTTSTTDIDNMHKDIDKGQVSSCAACGYPSYSPPGVRCTSNGEHDWPVRGLALPPREGEPLPVQYLATPWIARLRCAFWAGVAAAQAEWKS